MHSLLQLESTTRAGAVVSGHSGCSPWGKTCLADLRPYEDEIRSVEGQVRNGAACRHDSRCLPNLRDQRYINGPQTQRSPHPAAQVLGCLAECERMQVSHSFALLNKRVGLKAHSITSSLLVGIR